MTSEEAQFILRAYRANGQDARDPQFVEALEHARRDPNLAQWWEEERALDVAICAKLKEVPIPRDLRSAIQTGSRVAPSARVRSRRIIWAMAASILILIGLSFWWQAGQRSDFVAFRQDMARLIKSGSYSLQFWGADGGEVRHWLKEHRGHGDFDSPVAFAEAPTFGCQVMDWKGRPVSLVCFRLEGTVAHLFIIDRADLQSAPAEGPPEIARVRGEFTAGWTAGGKTYVLTGVNDPEMLRRLL